MEHQMEQQTSAGFTFAVSDVTRATNLLPVVPYPEALAATLGIASKGNSAAETLEAYSRETKCLLTPQITSQSDPIHAFIQAANLAYDGHRPLTLSPDMIWLLITQGFALHVSANAEALRSHFVAHKGKSKIAVVRNHFVRGFAGNDWEGVFGEFSEQIKMQVGEKAHGLICRTFSTTGIVEKAAFEVTLMDAYQSYFDYRVRTLCGIPEITLEGTPEDWLAIREGAEALSEFQLDWWTIHLLPFLDQFVAASQGIIDQSFWHNFYKIKNGSGGPYINGNIVNLFPYLVYSLPSPDRTEKKLIEYLKQFKLSTDKANPRVEKQHETCSTSVPNPYLGWKEPAAGGRTLEGLTSRTLPSALSAAPFTWEYHGAELPMQFVAGFVGVAQDSDTLALRPEIGWAVRDRNLLTAHG